MKVRATPTVWQINLASIQFRQNKKNWPPTVWQTNLAKYKLGKTQLPTRIYVCADRGCHRRLPVGGRVKKEINNKEGFLM
jgi:hypothetical protein